MEILSIQCTTFTGIYDCRYSLYCIEQLTVRPSLFLSSNLGSLCQHSVLFYVDVNIAACYDFLYPTPYLDVAFVMLLHQLVLVHTNCTDIDIIYQRSHHIFQYYLFRRGCVVFLLFLEGPRRDLLLFRLFLYLASESALFTILPFAISTAVGHV